jgi:hypothetical protein
VSGTSSRCLYFVPSAPRGSISVLEALIRPEERQGSGYAAQSEEWQRVRSGKGEGSRCAEHTLPAPAGTGADLCSLRASASSAVKDQLSVFRGKRGWGIL